MTSCNLSLVAGHVQAAFFDAFERHLVSLVKGIAKAKPAAQPAAGGSRAEEADGVFMIE